MRSRPIQLAIVSVSLTLSACADATTDTTTTEAAVLTVADTPTTAARSSASTSTAEFTGEVTITPPDEIHAGEEFTVEWTAPDLDSDYLTIVVAGADEGTYTTFFYTKNAEQPTLIAPTEPGEFEIRYVDGRTQATVHSVPVTVLP